METGQHLQVANIYSDRSSIVNVDLARMQFYTSGWYARDVLIILEYGCPHGAN